MSRDSDFFLEDIEKACSKITRFTTGMNFENFISDEKSFDAVIRNLEIVGEAAKRLPEKICSEMPEVEWKKVKGLRDIIAHEYFGIDKEIIWNVVCNKIPELQKAIQIHRKKCTRCNKHPLS